MYIFRKLPHINESRFGRIWPEYIKPVKTETKKGNDANTSLTKKQTIDNTNDKNKVIK